MHIPKYYLLSPLRRLGDGSVIGDTGRAGFMALVVARVERLVPRLSAGRGPGGSSVEACFSGLAGRIVGPPLWVGDGPAGSNSELEVFFSGLAERGVTLRLLVADGPAGSSLELEASFSGFAKRIVASRLGVEDGPVKQ